MASLFRITNELKMVTKGFHKAYLTKSNKHSNIVLSRKLFRRIYISNWSLNDKSRHHFLETTKDVYLYNNDKNIEWAFQILHSFTNYFIDH